MVNVGSKTLHFWGAVKFNLDMARAWEFRIPLVLSLNVEVTVSERKRELNECDECDRKLRLREESTREFKIPFMLYWIQERIAKKEIKNEYFNIIRRSIWRSLMHKLRTEILWKLTKYNNNNNNNFWPINRINKTLNNARMSHSSNE